MTDYDITFCEGENCQRKEQCHRYRHLLRYRADKVSHKKPYITVLRLDNPETCPLFWREKGEEI